MSDLKYPKCHDCAIVDCGERAKYYPTCYIKLSDAPRPAVKEFAKEMEKQLRANESKGGWEQCPSGPLLDGLIYNQGRLRKAIMDRDREAITRCSANVANFAMMLSGNEGASNLRSVIGSKE